MKLTKNQIHTWVKEDILEFIGNAITENNPVMDKTIKYKDKEGNEKEATVGGILKYGQKHPAHSKAKQMTDKDTEKKPIKKTIISANPFDPEKPKDEPSDMDTEKPTDDVGGPAHPNVPKKKPSKSKTMKIKADPFGGKEKTTIKKGG